VDLFLIEAVLNPPAQLPRGVILPPGNRAKLHAQRHAACPKRFDSEDTRPVNKNWGP
jgi:hypothetical protein